jgi:hypothetical protein
MTQYLGVIGRREYFELDGIRRPYWEFLDRQPDGWLTSLLRVAKEHTRADNPPHGRMVWDCGAWNYRKKEVPTFDARQALDRYLRVANPGSTLIAPDHMLIEGVDLAARRRFNSRSARTFIQLCPPSYTPMGPIHGQSLKERVKSARTLVDLGYQHFAVGGVAAIASRKSMVLEIVQAIKEVTGDAHLHVLGLSSPGFIRRFRDLGVDSCDGSSHFYHAFKGTYLTTHPVHPTRYERWTALKPGKVGPPLPGCNCRACLILRSHGVDIRKTGSSLHSLGRAAHNQNTIMRSQAIAMRRRIVLVACCGQKLSKQAPASDLYQSALFTKSRQWAEANGDQWFILSAKHGLVDPATVLRPYDETLPNSKTDRIRWTLRVRDQLLASVRAVDTVTVLAGRRYCDWASMVSFTVDRPMEGLGIGQQLNWLTNAISNLHPRPGPG